MSPSKLFAYIAMGRPLITSDLPAVAQYVADLPYVRVTPGSTEAFAAAMLKESRRDSFLESSQKRAALFSWYARGQRILNI